VRETDVTRQFGPDTKLKMKNIRNSVSKAQ